MARIRHDIATLTLGQDADAETQPWHPVLDTYARGVELMCTAHGQPAIVAVGGQRPRDPHGHSGAAGVGLGPVHFLKISHHGSHNGAYDELFDELIPAQSPDGRDRHALVSTHDGDWDSVPDTDKTLSLYSSRCALQDTRTVALGGSLEIRFPGPVPDRSRPSA
jgi:hypothetical protein